MPIKSIKLLTLLAVITLAMLLFSGCGKSGSKIANQEPSISITSYEGFDNDSLLVPYADVEFLFQQKIFWQANDSDGVIIGFAYRVRDQNGNPIATPGNHYIDLAGDVTPQNVIDRFGPGWVLHYKNNADQSVPLDDPESARTIWSSAKFATINFPAADANGLPLTTESTFEVIAIDNRGGITPLYIPKPEDQISVSEKTSIAWRKFNATSIRPTCSVTTTKGNPLGGQVGSGLRLSFMMKDEDPFISETPFKFEFRMMKVDPTTEAVIAGTESEWFNSSSVQDPKMEEFLLTRYTTPSLTYDVVDGVVNTKTKIQARAYDLAGVVSEVNDSTQITFAVKAGFRPKSLIYTQRVYALGDNHFIDYTDESTSEVLPFTIIGGVQRFATPFFRNTETAYTAVNSNNIKVWLRWGWHGEYGKVLASGDILITDNPFDKKVDLLIDRYTDENYFSEITHFDLRLDGEPYNYPPFANSIVIDGDGKDWLRVPLYSPLGQTLVLTALDSGEHTLEARTVDLQGEVDPEPATFTFRLDEPTPAANRNGVLVIDDDFNNNSTSPDATVRANYEQMLSGYSGVKTFIKRTSTGEPNQDTYADARLRHFAPSDLQQYKLVIYHSDNPSDAGNLKIENDGLSLYMRSGGNLMISHTSKLASVLDSFVLATQKTLLSYLGVSYISPPAKILSDALQTRPFFQKAVGESGYPDIDLQYTANGAASFNPLVNNFQGLATLTYFHTKAATANVIYKMGIKPVGFTPAGPTQEQFDTYNNQPIGLRNIAAGGNRCYIFGFPLSYMQPDDAQAMMNQVLTELGLI